MTKEFTTREEHGKKIKKSFSSIKFSCIKCGLQKIEMDEIQSYPNKGTEIAYVTALLFCRRCKHRYHAIKPMLVSLTFYSLYELFNELWIRINQTDAFMKTK